MVRTRPATHQAPPGAEARPPALAMGCIYALILLNLVQLAAGLSDVDIRPPEDVLPLIAATAALGVVAVPLVQAGARLGYQVGIAFSVLSMVGMGPHKLLLDNGLAISPMAALGFVGAVVVIVIAARELRRA